MQADACPGGFRACNSIMPGNPTQCMYSSVAPVQESTAWLWFGVLCVNPICTCCASVCTEHVWFLSHDLKRRRWVLECALLYRFADQDPFALAVLHHNSLQVWLPICMCQCASLLCGVANACAWLGCCATIEYGFNKQCMQSLVNLQCWPWSLQGRYRYGCHILLQLQDRCVTSCGFGVCGRVLWAAMLQQQPMLSAR
jgi:hypothetical protein